MFHSISWKCPFHQLEMSIPTSWKCSISINWKCFVQPIENIIQVDEYLTKSTPWNQFLILILIIDYQHMQISLNAICVVVCKLSDLCAFDRMHCLIWNKFCEARRIYSIARVVLFWSRFQSWNFEGYDAASEIAVSKLSTSKIESPDEWIVFRLRGPPAEFRVQQGGNEYKSY